MTHRLKGIGLASIAMLALGALSVSAASANQPAGLTLLESPATIIGEDEVVSVLTRGTRSVTCNVGTYHGEAENHDTTISLVPTYEQCHTSIAGSFATVHKGCYYKYEFTGEQDQGVEEFTATADFICGHGSDHTRIEVWLSKASHEEAKAPTCAYTFGDTHENKPVNQNFEGIQVTNKAASSPEGTPVNWFAVDVDIDGIISTRTAGSTLVCGSLLDKGGELHAKTRLKLDNEDGEEVGATISTHTA
jgi:hypothetical protein